MMASLYSGPADTPQYILHAHLTIRRTRHHLRSVNTIQLSHHADDYSLYLVLSGGKLFGQASEHVIRRISSRR